MNLFVSARSETTFRRFGAWSVTSALLVAAGALGGCHKGSGTGSASNLPQGSLSLLPGQGNAGTLNFLVEPNGGGKKARLKIVSARWGRLADIRDGDGIVRHRDFVIGESVVSSNEYIVEANPVSEKTTVTIRSTFSTNPDSEYVLRLRALESSLTLLDDKSLSASELPPYPLVPRNAAIVLEFDDLVDPNTLSADSLRVVSGYPPVTPFDTRLITDKNHGDLADFDGQPGLEFYSTRVIIDSTISTIEAAETNPPLPVNALGLPASITQGQANIGLRLPTRVDPEVGQLVILRNLNGRGLDVSENGSVDSLSSTLDVVRALRSGGTTTLDVNNGFLADGTAPSVLGVQAATATNVAPGPTPATFVGDLVFAVPTCANRLVAGDVIQQGGVFGEVICPPLQVCAPDSPVTGDINGSTVPTVFFRIIATDVGGPQTIEAGPVSVSMRYTSNVPAGKERCFVRFPQITLPPDRNVAPTSSVIVRFTKPMDPATMKPFDTMMLMRKNPETNATPTAYDYVVGAVTASPDLREYSFQPALPLTHDPISPVNVNTGQTTIGEEPYYLNLLSGANGPTDLPGNPLSAALPAVMFTLDATASKQDTNGFSLRFSSVDEISGIGGDTSTGGVGKRELRGQFLIDTTRQTLRSRPVVHYSAAADRTQPVPSIMLPFGPGVQTPLSKLGSKMQTLWRYCDVGFGLLDEANHNVDVEGLSWSPVSAAVVADSYTRFELSVAHCLRLPDESVDPVNLLLLFPASGLITNYSQNQLDPVRDPLKRVYPVAGGPTGYSFAQADVYQGPTGTKFVHWPMNRGVARALYTYYTWRDTALLTKGAPADSPGAELPINNSVTATGLTNGQPFPTGQVPTIGLPILMEFRCYPDDAASGLNAFDISVATASSSRPNFRAFSTGGVNTQNQTVRKDPDLQPIATGGFNPTSTPAPGATTPPADNSFYIGNLDLVTRISRVHSIWFDATAGTVQYSAPVIEPRDTDQPTGTQIVLAYRGATQVQNNTLLTDSAAINWYGDRLTTIAGADPIFLNGDNTWKNNITQINGARFFQVRITFLSNPETNLSPELSAIGFTYRK